MHYNFFASWLGIHVLGEGLFKSGRHVKFITKVWTSHKRLQRPFKKIIWLICRFEGIPFSKLTSGINFYDNVIQNEIMVHQGFSKPMAINNKALFEGGVVGIEGITSNGQHIFYSR